MKRTWIIVWMLAASPAAGDALEATLGEPIAETGHKVSVTRDGAIATLTVRRQIHNAGDLPEEAVLTVELPEGGVATGLRLATAGDRWIEGKLLASIDAQERYGELTGIGSFAPKDPALLAWRSTGQVELRIFPIAARATSTVEYTITAPLAYEGGRFVLRYPASQGVERLIPPELRASIKGAEVVAGGADVVVSLPAAAIDVAEGQAGAFRLGPDRVLGRIGVDVAPVLAPAPRGARVVFVVDASRSEGEQGIEQQLALVRGYLDSLPDARYEVVLFRRGAERLIGSFATANELEQAIDRAGGRLAPGNGSNLEVGLATASLALRDVKGPKRIVAFTDGRLRDALTTAGALGALAELGEDAVVHVVKRGPDTAGALSERRDEHDPLATIAEAHGGVLIEVTGAGDRAAAARAARGLVLPIRIDGFAIAWGDDAIETPGALDAGTGFRAFAIARDAPARVTLTGKIWAKPWTRTIELDRALGPRIAALVFGDPIASELSEEEMHRAAAAGGAVSPVTSYLAIEPGARPSTEGVGVPQGGLLGSEIGGAWGVGIGGIDESEPSAGKGDVRAVLAEWLRPAAQRCAVNGEATVVVEVTGEEIVDVRSANGCLAEAAWGLWLDDRFVAIHDRLEIRIPRAP